MRQPQRKALLCEHRENEGSVLSQKRPSQTGPRSSGGRCHKSHATSPPATRPFERSISRLSPHERLRAVCTCPGRRCRRFLSQSPFQSEAYPRIKGAFSIPTSPTFLIEGSAGCWNGSQLYSEVKELGYTGSEALFRLFISSVRKHHQAPGTSAKLELSANGAKVNGPLDPASKPCIKRRLSPARARLSLCEPICQAG